jgi:LAGLIDADG endonuclease
MGSSVKLVFRITQHIRDELLIISFIQYFGCGKVYKKTGKDAVDFMVTGFSYITNKVLPFLCEYPVLGKKS